MNTAEDMLREKGGGVISMPQDAMILEALRVMVDNKISAIAVKNAERIVGIWTGRDLMRDTLTSGFDPSSTRLGDKMDTRPRSYPHTHNIYALMDIFLGRRLRHLLIEKDGKCLGLLSVGDVMRACLQEKAEQLKELHAMASWEYHEEWKWGRR
ncbi:MAG: CBS domain-containing protein [Elusimicrobiota bacterium]